MAFNPSETFLTMPISSGSALMSLAKPVRARSIFANFDSLPSLPATFSSR
jgi:hypothetical protein